MGWDGMGTGGNFDTRFLWVTGGGFWEAENLALLSGLISLKF